MIDKTAPSLIGLTLPKQIDLSKGAASAQFAAQARDEAGGTGVSRVALILDNNMVFDFGAAGSISVGASYGGPDTFSDSTPNYASSSVNISALTGAGTYKVTDVYVYDVAGNVAIYNSAQLAQLGINTSFSVASTAARDTNAPKLLGLTLPSTIDLSKGAASVQFAAQARDEAGGTGVSRVALILDNNMVFDFGAAGSISVGASYGGPDTFSDSTPNYASSSVNISALTGAGTYKVTDVYVYDVAGNVAMYNSAQLAQLGINTSFSVAGAAARDTTAPTLLGLTLPSTIDLSKGAASVQFAAQARDEAGGTGVSRVALILDNNMVFDFGAAGSISVGASYGGPDTFSDSTPNYASSSVNISALTGAGTYKVTDVYVYDVAGNVAMYNSAQLAQLGINAGFTVVDGKALPTPSAAITPSILGGKVHLALSSNDWTASGNQFSLTLKYDAGAASYSSVNVIGSGASSLSISSQETGASGTLTIVGTAANGVKPGAFLDVAFTLNTSASGVQYTLAQFAVNGVQQSLADGGKTNVGYGSASPDMLAGGRNYQDGGAGLDTIAYQGSSAGYTVTKTQAGYLVSGALGTYETLVNIERIKFTDQSVALDVEGASGQAYRIYQAAFDRQPDKGGLGYWLTQIDKGASLVSVAGGFIQSSEFSKLYGSAPSTQEFVEKLYHNVLHRAPDLEGKNYWTQRMDMGESKAQVLMEFSESPENHAQVIGAIQNGIMYTPYG